MDLGKQATWRMREADGAQWIPASVPGCIFSDLMAAGKLPDPYYRDQEELAKEASLKDYVYEGRFALTREQLQSDALVLIFHGLDTLCDVLINGQFLLHADNMHRVWTADIKPFAKAGENTLEVRFASAFRYMREHAESGKALVIGECTAGAPLLRKTLSMSGWDWGPRMPGAGIWREVELQMVSGARLSGVRMAQRHEDGSVTLSFAPEIQRFGCEQPRVTVTVTAPDGEKTVAHGEPMTLSHPQLWWPNGYGEQPLYRVQVELTDESGSVLDTWQGRIGLRSVGVKREKDADGESFAITVNGVSIFAMGADYIPEDSITARCTPERTRQLIDDCVQAHFNCIRVWGGGWYPSDAFLDACDEAGLLLWQDFMFACATYEMTDAFRESVRMEIRDQTLRLSHHACLALYCGNNEMEMFAVQGRLITTPAQRADYLELYEQLIPHTLRLYDTQTYYWPSSPSSGGGFDEPNDPHRGDVHYWDVWHGCKPFTAYRDERFRFASEFGFQSFPCLRTMESFTAPEDRNIFSYVCERHQRNDAANGKILNYLSQTYRYPYDFDTLLYASQLLQADAIRYGVEHWRRHRGCCMGAIYWQLNDCWPVASWASIDYFGRWKALHYAARRFFAPILLSCEEEGTHTQDPNVNAQPYPLRVSARLNVSNETMQEAHVRVAWQLRRADASVIRQGGQVLTVAPLSAQWMEKIDCSDVDIRRTYFAYQLYQGDALISEGTTLFVPPKHFEFPNPKLSIRREGDALIVSAESYAKCVEIVCEDGDVVLSDNDFDMNAGEKRVTIARGAGSRFRVRSVYDIG